MTYAKNPSMWYCCKVLVGEPYKQSLCISPLNFWFGRNLLEICQKFARNLPEIWLLYLTQADKLQIVKQGKKSYRIWLA
ncbi:hypothetical protein [Microcoleus sp.]|uniref:hypothetical protein n=1 Tax=Microcoleus sp. TaxID=44472 RepID=UPI003593CD4D